MRTRRRKERPHRDGSYVACGGVQLHLSGDHVNLFTDKLRVYCDLPGAAHGPITKLLNDHPVTLCHCGAMDMRLTLEEARAVAVALDRVAGTHAGGPEQHRLIESWADAIFDLLESPDA